MKFMKKTYVTQDVVRPGFQLSIVLDLAVFILNYGFLVKYDSRRKMVSLAVLYLTGSVLHFSLISSQELVGLKTVL